LFNVSLEIIQLIVSQILGFNLAIINIQTDLPEDITEVGHIPTDVVKISCNVLIRYT
jgi:hypothetical protein